MGGIKAVTVAQSPATAVVKRVMGRKVVTTFRSPRPDALVSLGTDPPQAPKLRITVRQLNFTMLDVRQFRRLEQ